MSRGRAIENMYNDVVLFHGLTYGGKTKHHDDYAKNHRIVTCFYALYPPAYSGLVALYSARGVAEPRR